VKNNKIRELEEELEKTKSELGICQARLSIVERKYLKECTDEDLCKSKQKIIDELEKNIQDLQEEIDIYANSVKSLTKANLELENQVKALTAQNEELKSKLNSTLSCHNDFVKDLEIKLQEAINNNLICTERVKKLEKENSDLFAQLQQLKAHSPSPVAASNDISSMVPPSHSIEIDFEKMILLTQALLRKDCVLVFDLLFASQGTPHPAALK